jgi:hypothetical protein
MLLDVAQRRAADQDGAANQAGSAVCDALVLEPNALTDCSMEHEEGEEPKYPVQKQKTVPNGKDRGRIGLALEERGE